MTARPQSRARRAAAPDRGRPEPAPAPGATDLFAPPPVDDPEASEPGALARAATLASGRAMTARLWTEARALAALAESYTRLATRFKATELTVETMDLRLLYEAMDPDPEVLRERFWVREGDDPDREVKVAFWRRRNDIMTAASQEKNALLRRVYKAEEIARELGGTVVISPAGQAAEQTAAPWAALTRDEIDEACDGGQSGQPLPPRRDRTDDDDVDEDADDED